MAKKPTQPAALWPPLGPTFEEGLIVGLLMARGSFTGDKHTARLAILSGDLEMLQWIKSRIGGSVAGPYSQKGRKPHYMFQLSGAALRPIMELLSAYMPTGAQRTRYLAWIAKYWPNGLKPLDGLSRLRPSNICRETLDCFT